MTLKKIAGVGPTVIASEAKQSSAREARQLKSAEFAASSALYFARLPARGWIASAFALWATADKSLRHARRSSKSEGGSQ
jgi:hypothetical protein